MNDSLWLKFAIHICTTWMNFSRDISTQSRHVYMTKESLQVEGYDLQLDEFYQDCLPKHTRPEWIPLWFSTQILQLMICVHEHVVPSSRRQIVGSALEKEELHLVYCWFTYQIDYSCAELIIGLLLSNTYQWRWSYSISFISFSTIDNNECSYHFSINSVNS